VKAWASSGYFGIEINASSSYSLMMSKTKLEMVPQALHVFWSAFLMAMRGIEPKSSAPEEFEYNPNG